jgi:hypothetical protein
MSQAAPCPCLVGVSFPVFLVSFLDLRMSLLYTPPVWPDNGCVKGIRKVYAGAEKELDGWGFSKVS